MLTRTFEQISNLSHEAISVFDMFKIGVGPSSSHTLGPWRASQRFVTSIQSKQSLDQAVSLKVMLYGSLAKTGKGHVIDASGFTTVQLGGGKPDSKDSVNGAVIVPAIENILVSVSL